MILTNAAAADRPLALTFAPGSIIAYTCTVYDGRSDRTAGFSTTATVLRDGKPVYTSPPAPIAGAATTFAAGGSRPLPRPADAGARSKGRGLHAARQRRARDRDGRAALPPRRRNGWTSSAVGGQTDGRQTVGGGVKARAPRVLHRQLSLVHRSQFARLVGGSWNLHLSRHRAAQPALDKRFTVVAASADHRLVVHRSPIGKGALALPTSDYWKIEQSKIWFGFSRRMSERRVSCTVCGAGYPAGMTRSLMQHIVDAVVDAPMDDLKDDVKLRAVIEARATEFHAKHVVPVAHVANPSTTDPGCHPNRRSLSYLDH